MSSVFLTVVSNNIPNLARFISLWREFGDFDGIIAMHDLPEAIDLGATEHVSQKECSASSFGEAVSYGGCGTARSYAFVRAVSHGADYVVSMDDDCLPLPEYLEGGYKAAYMDAMTHTRWDWLIPGIRTRGIPYETAGKIRSHFHVGLWRGLADLDSIALMSGQRTVPLPAGSRIIPHGMLFPWSIGNSCFHKELLPATLLPNMGATSPYLRYEDIWAGVILKMIADHMSYVCSVGPPFVEHRSEIKAFGRLGKEVTAMAANEWFWKRIECISISDYTVAGCVREVAEEMHKWPEPYFKDYAKRMNLFACEAEALI